MSVITQSPVNAYDDGQIIEFDATFTSLMQAVVSSGGTGQPAAGTTETLTVSTSQPWPILLGGQSLLVMDSAELGGVAGFEVMSLTANANGVGASWTVVRGTAGTGTTAHAAGWTAIPVRMVGPTPKQIQLLCDPTTVAWSFAFTPSGSQVPVGEVTYTYSGSSTPQVGTLWRAGLGAYRTWVDSTGKGPALLSGKFVSTGVGQATKPRWAIINARTIP